jgi:VWFA-related protein
VNVKVDDSPAENIQVEALSQMPLAVGGIIDNSGSTARNKFHLQAVSRTLGFVERIAREGKNQAFWVNFANEYYLDQALTKDSAGLERAAARIQARGGSAIFDATISSCDYVKRGSTGRRALILVSDGNDNRSMRGKKETPGELARSGCTVFAISTEDLDSRVAHEESLKLLTEETGGRFFHPHNDEQLQAALAAIEADIGAEYLVSFAVPVSDGKVHALRVGSTDGTLSVRAPRHVLLPEKSSNN